MGAIKRLALGLALFGVLVPFAHSVPDNADGQAMVPVEPSVTLSCPKEPVPRGSQPALVLLVTNPTGRMVDFDGMDRRLALNMLRGQLRIKTAGSHVRLGARFQDAIDNPPLAFTYLCGMVGTVLPFDQEQMVTGLDPFDERSLSPGSYRLPYEFSYSYKVQEPNGTYSEPRYRTSSGVLEFTVVD